MSAAPRPYIALQPGEPAPWFHQRSGDNPHFAFDTAAGRYLVLCFLASSRDPLAEQALKAVKAHRALFDDIRMSFFGVTMDRRDESEKRLKTRLPGIRYFFDFDGTIGKIYGALPADLKPDEANVAMRRFWVVLGPSLRVLRVFAFEADGGEQAALFQYLKALPPPELSTGFALRAPVIVLNDVFEPELCRGLIALYEKNGGTPSGFMRDVNGKTVQILDLAHKQRSDYLIEEKDIIRAIQIRVQRRILPEILKAFQFRATRMERYIVSCYDAKDGGHFRPHRDNTTKGTAHRRFAVSVNLNDDFDGGELGFPEYGPAGFKMPVGGAAIFSCSLLHMVSPVTRGKRYAFLPFLYDDEAAKIRAENNRFLGPEVSAYRETEADQRALAQT